MSRRELFFNFHLNKFSMAADCVCPGRAAHFSRVRRPAGQHNGSAIKMSPVRQVQPNAAQPDSDARGSCPLLPPLARYCCCLQTAAAAAAT